MADSRSTYQQSGPSAPQTARAVLFAPPGQVKGFGDVPAFIVTSGVRIQARAAGAGGEAITVALVAGTANQPLGVTAVGNAITVQLATNAASASVSTAREVSNALNTTAASNALVAAAVVQGDGSQVVAPIAATALAGDTVVGSGTLGNAPLPKQHPQSNAYA